MTDLPMALCNLSEVFDAVCPNCGDTGIGLLGVHEIPGFERVDDGDQGFLIPTMEYQEEYGSPCPTCGKKAPENGPKSQPGQ